MTRKQIPILLAIILAILAVRSSIIEPFRIPTRSMLPGLLTGDFLFANKLQYGIRIPFTETYLTSPKPARRGDIIIFSPPEAGQESLYIKRVVGLPGDRIRFSGKQFFLNDEPVRKIEVTGAERDALLQHPGFDPEERYLSSKLHLYRESIDDRSYLILEDDSFEGNRANPELTVPEDHYFVLGDNRDDTRDSRLFGVIPFSSIRGRAFVIWFSYRISFNDSKWSFRPERIGKIIE
jgi:signal peptidase I